MAVQRSSNSVQDDSEARKFECEQCHDMQYVAKLDDETVVWLGDPRTKDATYWAVECDCLKEQRIARMFKSSHITEAFQQLGFRNFVTNGRPACVADAKDAAAEYLKRFAEIRKTRQNSLALLGQPGCGKTHLLIAVSNNLLRSGIQVQYFPWVEGGNELKDDLDKLEAKTKHMKTVDVLYIDDLFKGRNKPTPLMLEQMFGVINFRSLNHLPILLSSELDMNEICEVDQGLGSRLFQMCRDYTVTMSLTSQEKANKVQLNYRLKVD